MKERRGCIPGNEVRPNCSALVIIRTLLLFGLTWLLYLIDTIKELPRKIRHRSYSYLPRFIISYLTCRHLAQSPKILAKIKQCLDEAERKNYIKPPLRAYSSYVWKGRPADFIYLLKENSQLSKSARKKFLELLKVGQGKLYLRDYLRTDQDLSYGVIRSVVSCATLWFHWYVPVYVKKAGIDEDDLEHYVLLQRWLEFEPLLKNGGLEVLIFWDLDNLANIDRPFFRVSDFEKELGQYKKLVAVLGVELDFNKYRSLIEQTIAKTEIVEEQERKREEEKKKRRDGKPEPHIAPKGKFRVVKISIGHADGLYGTPEEPEDYIFPVDDYNSLENAKKVADNVTTGSLQGQVHDDTGECLYSAIF